MEEKFGKPIHGAINNYLSKLLSLDMSNVKDTHMNEINLEIIIGSFTNKKVTGFSLHLSSK